MRIMQLKYIVSLQPRTSSLKKEEIKKFPFQTRTEYYFQYIEKGVIKEFRNIDQNLVLEKYDEMLKIVKLVENSEFVQSKIEEIYKLKEQFETRYGFKYDHCWRC